ncbi:MAG: DUF2914 domain-containing protein [Gammaproteobacteria bacterium]|nr:DUF2914 domain-containing protein [Gammaproteobacteria bacterium]MCI0590257.1 DUF2914 domain-containing protein [Gammaproteobacteria bacterium]
MRLNVPLLTAAFIVVLVIPARLQAEELEVHDPLIATSIRDHVPQGINTTFPAFVGKLYAFTRIIGATDATFITHAWHYGDYLVGEVALPVRSSNWRTWSAKNISPDWIGQWRVDVQTEDGTVIDRIYFTVE